MKDLFAAIGWGHISALAGWVSIPLIMYLINRLLYKRNRVVVIAFGSVLVIAGILIYLFRGFMSFEYPLSNSDEWKSLIEGLLVSFAGIFIILKSKKLAGVHDKS